MGVSLNKTGFKYAKSLISRGKVDRGDSWEFSAEDGNKLLGPDGDDWELYGKFHLVVDSDEPEDTKGRWKYPFGKGGKVFRKGVIAAKSRAAQQGETSIEEAASELLELIDREDSLSGSKASRVDMFGDWTEFLTSPMTKTHDGFMSGRAVVTNIGVFKYPQADGTVRYELRHPDDVFDPESISSLEGKPLTNDHPVNGVTPDTYKALTIGAVSSPSADAYHVTAGISVNDAQAIRDIQSGKRALSCGYDCMLQDVSHLPETERTYQGMVYTHRQRDIRYNHVALVDAGRAGTAAKLRMDSIQLHNITTQPGVPMKKIRLDHVGGLEVEVDPTVAAELDAIRADAAAAEKSASEAKAALDAATGRADGAEAEVAKLKEELVAANDSVKFDAAVGARVALLATATKFGAKVDAASSDRAIREAVCLLANPEAKFDGKSDEYVGGVFDFAVKALEAGSARHDAATGPGAGSTAHDPADSVAASLQELLDQARRDSMDKLHAAYIKEGE